MTTAEMIGLLIAGFVGYGVIQKARSKGKDVKIQELNKDKAKEEGKIEVLKEQQGELKEQVANEQANASEEAKANYWKKYVAKKNADKSTDS